MVLAYFILILALYGHDNILYYIINGFRFVFFYGLCYTAPSLYNSENGALFAFSVFLLSIRFLIFVFKCIHLLSNDSRFYWCQIKKI
jgi:hypothetical protein